MSIASSRAVALHTMDATRLRGSIPAANLPRSLVHTLALAAVWITVASGAFVFVEPAPFDALMFGLFVLLPVVGLVKSKPELNAGLALWLAVIACGLISAALARDMGVAAKHILLSLYLVGLTALFATFIARKPEAHTKLVLNAYFAASLFAASLGVIGYLNLFPGAGELLTRYGRATATFKDPNVYGPFLIPGLLFALHKWLTKPMEQGIGWLAAASIILVGILFSFSRGAWAATLIAVALYCYLYAVTAPKNRERVKLAALVLIGTALLGIILAAAFQSDAIGRFLAERAALDQSYDTGAEGRFGGQAKAFDLILENPLGLGSLMFSAFHHHEEVHNVYLSMLLNAGWLGGLLYLALCAGTIALGFQHALKRTATQPLFFILYAALTANILEGVLIDTDHWRHFYLLMGVVWGLMAADTRELRVARIVADRRPVLLRPVLMLPPTSRAPRIIRRLPRPIDAMLLLDDPRFHNRVPKRAPRINLVAPAAE